MNKRTVKPTDRDPPDQEDDKPINEPGSSKSNKGDAAQGEKDVVVESVVNRLNPTEKVADESTQDKALKMDNQDEAYTVLAQKLRVVQSNQDVVSQKVKAMSRTPFFTYIASGTPSVAGSGLGGQILRFVDGVIPTLVKWIKASNARQLGPIAEGESSITLTNKDQVQRSVDLYSYDTALIRPRLSTVDFGGKDIDLNEIGSETILSITSVKGSRDVDQQLGKFYTSRLRLFLQIFKDTRNNIITGLKKEAQPVEGVRGLIHELSTQTFWVGDNPHPYLAVVSPQVAEWFKNEMEQASQIAPLRLGESAVDQDLGVKQAATAHVVTDQWTARILEVTHEYYRANQFRDANIPLMLAAGLFPQDAVFLDEMNMENTRLLYRPTPNEQRGVIYYVMANQAEQQYILDSVTAQVQSTGRLRMLSNPPSIDHTTFTTSSEISQIVRLLDQIVRQSNVELERVIALETFTYLYDLDLINASTTAAPSGFLNIFNCLLWFIMLPRQSQKLVHELGYVLCINLSQYVPEAWNAWMMAHGAIGRVENNRWVPEIGTPLRQLTRDEVIAGWTYSVFIQHPEGERNRRVLRQIFGLITYDLDEIRLERKLQAGFPYFHENYMARPSWPEIAVEYGDHPTNIGVVYQRVYELIDWITDLNNERQNISSKDQDTKARVTILQWLKSVAVTFGGVEFTMRRVQEVLMNSAPFLRDDYVPNEQTIRMTPNLCLAPALKRTDAEARRPPNRRTGVPFQRIKCQLNFWTPYHILVGAEGEYTRAVQQHGQSRNLDVSNDQADIPQLKEISTFQPEVQLNWYLDRIKPASSFLTGWHFALCVFDSERPNNPLIQWTRMVGQDLLKMNNAIPIVKEIFRWVGDSWTNYLLLNSGYDSGVIDPRMIDIRLMEVDPITNLVRQVRVPGTLIGQIIETSNGYTDEIARVVSYLTFNQNSTFLQMATGIQIGAYLVQDLSLYNQFLVNPAEQDMQIIIPQDRIRFEQANVKEGQGRAIIVELEDGTELAVTSKYQRLLRPYILEITDISRVRLEFVDFLVGLVAEKNVALRFPRTTVSYNVKDCFEKERDVTESIASITELTTRILRSPTSSIIDVSFPSTIHSVGYDRADRNVPYYTQWVYLLEPPNRNEWAAVLSNTIGRPENAVVPAPRCLGFGDGNGLYMPGTNMPKIQGELNINNSIRYFKGRPSTDLPKFVVVPGAVRQW